MSIIFSVIGGALLYGVCRVHNMIAQHEKYSKKLEQMQDTITKCTECSQAFTVNTTDLLFNSCELKNSSEQDQSFMDHFEKTSQNKLEDSKSPNGKITRNPFFNYVREQRPKRCGQPQKIFIKESAFKWKHLSKDDKFNYTYCAVHMRERSNNKDKNIINRKK